MSRWPYAFFAAAATYIMIGTNWGLYMSITHDFATAPAHAHLNLIGWVSMALMGVYYATLGQSTPRWMVAANFILLNVGVIGMISGLWLLFTDRAQIKDLAPLIGISEIGVIGGFGLFFLAAWRGLIGAGGPVRLFRRARFAPA